MCPTLLALLIAFAATCLGLVADSASPPLRRDVSLTTQVLAQTELISISQPTSVPDLANLKNYVYEQNAGEGSFVYHVEHGVAFGTHPDEFRNLAPEHLFTPQALANGWNQPGIEYSEESEDYGHSTCTADKAVGHEYGAAKMAALVTVVMFKRTDGPVEDTELMAALRLILDDLQKHPERLTRSVITYSKGGPPKGFPNAAQLKQILKDVMDNGIPVIVPSGNSATDRQEQIDELPALWASSDYPLIVVGSCNSAGERSTFSQTGPQLTTHAVADRTYCCNALDRGHTQGTSFSTPLVAGHVASLLSHDNKPFLGSNGKIDVKKVRDYIAQSPVAGWNRKNGIRMLWNGVDETQNPPTNPDDLPLGLKCADIGTNKYVDRETIWLITKDKFCHDAAVKGHPITIRYNEGTMEDFVMSTSYSDNNLKVYKDDCEKAMFDMITEYCDRSQPPSFTARAGGTATLDGIGYRIEPMSVRQPPDLGKGGGCTSSGNDFTIWGRDWSNTDKGQDIEANLRFDGCGLVVNTFNFQYGLGDNAREWTLKFTLTGELGEEDQKWCVTDAAVSAGGPFYLVCN